MKFKAKDRMALVSKKNMKKIIEYFDVEDHRIFDLSWAVNYLVDIAIGELKAIDEDIEKDQREFRRIIDES